jgi:hypothetical protein
MMRQIRETGRHVDRVVVLFLFALLLLASPLLGWWAADDSPWYLPYLLWLLVIMLAAWLHERYARDDL